MYLVVNLVSRPRPSKVHAVQRQQRLGMQCHCFRAESHRIVQYCLAFGSAVCEPASGVEFTPLCKSSGECRPSPGFNESKDEDASHCAVGASVSDGGIFSLVDIETTPWGRGNNRQQLMSGCLRRRSIQAHRFSGKQLFGILCSLGWKRGAPRIEHYAHRIPSGTHSANHHNGKVRRTSWMIRSRSLFHRHRGAIFGPPCLSGP